MNKAEELAKEYAENFILTVDHQSDVEEAYIDGYHQAEKDLTDRAKVSSDWDGFYYGQGYKQAEKDLELSWINIKDIYDICCDVFNDYDGDFYDMPKLWKEVLKRFKERKEK